MLDSQTSRNVIFLTICGFFSATIYFFGIKFIEQNSTAIYEFEQSIFRFFSLTFNVVYRVVIWLLIGFVIGRLLRKFFSWI